MRRVRKQWWVLNRKGPNRGGGDSLVKNFISVSIYVSRYIDVLTREFLFIKYWAARLKAAGRTSIIIQESDV